MKTQLAAAVLAVLLAAPCAAGNYSEAEIKKLFQQSVDTEDVRIRTQLRKKIFESAPDSACGIASKAFLLKMAGRLSPEQDIALNSKALELDPTLAVVYYNRANDYIDLDQNEKALDGFKKAISLGFKHGVAYLGLANAQTALGQYDAALENFGKALELTPGEAFAYNNRGNIYSLRGEYDKAIADFTAALKLSTFAMAYMNRGDAYAGKKDYQQALADYKRAEELIPDAPDLYTRRGKIYLKIKEYAKAGAEAETALSLDPRDTAALNLLGSAAYSAGNYERAEDACKRFAAAYPKDAHPYDILSTVYTAMKRGDLAEEALKKAVKLAPQRADLKDKLAKLQLKNGNVKEAEAGFTALISIGTGDTGSYLSRGEIRLEALNYKGAEADLKVVLKRTPYDPGAIVDLSLVFLRTGRRSEGLELFSSVMDTDQGLKKSARAGAAYAGDAPGKNMRAMMKEMFKLYDAGAAPVETAAAKARPQESAELTQDDCYCVFYTGMVPPYFLAKVEPQKPGCEKIKFKADPDKPGMSGLKSCDEFKKGV